MKEGAQPTDLVENNTEELSLDPSTLQAFEAGGVATNDPVEAQGMSALGYSPDIEAPNGYAEVPPLEETAGGSAYDNALSVQTESIVVDPSLSLATEFAAQEEGPLDINLPELTPAEPVDINIAEVTPLTPVDIDLTERAPLDINLDEPEKLDIDLTEQAPAATKEIAPDVFASFQERFPGISKESLESMEGFTDLSRGQQKMILENLSQLTVGRINKEAIDGEAEEFAEKQKDSKFLGKVWNGPRRVVMKGHDVVLEKKQLAKDIQNGGMEVHKTSLEQLVRGMKNLGPEVMEKADGTLEIQLIETKGMSPELSGVVEVFNEQGTALSKIPYEWSLDTATNTQKEAYANAKESYELQRGTVMKRMAEAGGEEMAVKAMAHTDSVIEMQRFIQTCPDAVKELKKIENESAWYASLKNVSTEKGMYMALGYGARSAIGVMAGFVAAPAVAAVSAGIRGWRKAGAELVAQDAAQRRGEEIPETKNMAAAQTRMTEIGKALTETTDEETKTALTMELTALQKSARGTAKNMIEAFNADDIAGDKKAESGDRRQGATAKIEYLKAKIASVDAMLDSGPAADEAGNLAEEKAKLVAQLERRVGYTKMKISEGKMVFGREDERLDNQYALSVAMASAEAQLALETATDEGGDTAERRLGKLLGKTDEEIGGARLRHKGAGALKGVVIGGVLATAGAELADAVKWMNGASGTLTEKMLGSAAAAKETIRDTVGSVVEGAAAVQDNIRDAAESIGESARSLGNQLSENFAQAHAETVAEISKLGVPLKNAVALESGFVGSRALAAEAVKSGESAGYVYTVKGGDNLTNMLKEKIGVLRSADDLPSSPQKDNLIENLLHNKDPKVGLTPEEMREVGIIDDAHPNADADHIFPGQHIDIAKLNEIIAKKSIGGQSLLEHAQGSVGGVASEHTPTTTTSVDALGVRTSVQEFPGTRVAPAVAGAEDAALTQPEGAVANASPAEKEKILNMFRKDKVYMEGGQAVDPTKIEHAYTQTPPKVEKVVEAVGVRMEHGAWVSPRNINEMTNADWKAWPTDKAEPWPMNDAEAAKWFDTAPEYLENAKAIKEAVGRYPSQAEYDEVMGANGATKNALLQGMKAHPLSADELAKIEAANQPGSSTPAETLGKAKPGVVATRAPVSASGGGVLVDSPEAMAVKNFNPDADFQFNPNTAAIPPQTIQVGGNLGKVFHGAEKILGMKPGKLTSMNLAEQDLTNSLTPRQEAVIAHEAVANAVMEKTNKIASSWEDMAARGVNKNPHWADVRAEQVKDLVAAPMGARDAVSLESARAQAHALIGKAEAMGFHARKGEPLGAFLDRMAKEIREPLTSERALERSHELYKVVYNQVPIHGQMRPMSADAIVGQKLLVGLEDTPSGKEFLAWKGVLSEVQKNTGIPPAPNEDIQSYIERASRVSLHKDPTLHASSLIGRKVDELALVTPKNVPQPPGTPRVEEVVPQKQPLIIERPKVLEQTPAPKVPPAEIKPAAPLVEKTEIVRAPGAMEAQIDKLLKPEIEAARQMYGVDADRPAGEVIAKLRASGGPMSKQFDAYLAKGYTPKPGESAINFYARAFKEEALQTRAPAQPENLQAPRAERVYTPQIPEARANIAFQPGHEQMKADLAGLFQNGADSNAWRVAKNMRADVALDSSWDDKLGGGSHTAVRSFLESKGVTLKTHPPLPGERLEQYFARIRPNEVSVDMSIPEKSILRSILNQGKFPNIAPEELKENLQSLSKEVGRTPSAEEFEAYMVNRFRGGWWLRDAMKASGKVPLTTEQIKQALDHKYDEPTR